jgi:hypothetical protein
MTDHVIPVRVLKDSPAAGETRLPPSPQASEHTTGLPHGPIGSPLPLPGRAPHGPASRVPIPEDLLDMARGGTNAFQIAHLLSQRVGRRVSPQTVRSRLILLGICHRRRNRRRHDECRLRVAAAPQDDLGFTAEDHRRLDAYHPGQREQRRRVLERARAGNLALIELYLRFGLRLPLVEAQLHHPLPWMKTNGLPSLDRRRVLATPPPIERSDV